MSFSHSLISRQEPRTTGVYEVQDTFTPEVDLKNIYPISYSFSFPYSHVREYIDEEEEAAQEEDEEEKGEKIKR